MKTRKQRKRQCRINNSLALLCVISILAFANYGAYWIGGLVPSIFVGIATILILINFPWYKFK